MAILDDSNGIIDPKTVSVRPLGTRWGLIWGLVGVVLSLVFTVTGMMDPTKNTFFSLPNLLTMAAGITIVYFGLVAHRDTELGGYLTMGRSIGFAVYMSLIAGIISAVYLFVYLNYIAPDFLDKIWEAQMDKAEASGQDPERVRQSMEIAKKFMSPPVMAIFAFLGSAFYGLIWGLLVGLFVKKESPRPF